MAGEKRFGSGLFGFRKADVNNYIEKILKEFDDRLKEKDDEISTLKNQNRELKLKYDDSHNKINQVNEDRTRIAEVLIRAQEKAEKIIEAAKEESLEEKRRLDQIIEQEREKLVDVKQDLKTLKSEVLITLKKYETQLSNILDEEFSENEEAVGE
jgi:hypothetical protein